MDSCSSWGKSKFLVILSSLYLVFSGYSAQAAELCVEGKRSLNGEFEVLQGAGGLWGYMEKSSALKEQSTLGLKVDSKLQRSIVIFSTLCETGKKPDQALFDKIQGYLKDAVTLNGKIPGKYPTTEFLAAVESLIKGLDDLLKQIES